MKEIEIAKWLNAGSKSKVNQVAGRTRTYTGVALEDSVDGKVHVDLGGDVVSAEGEQGIEVPCGPQVKEGDRVVITTVNGSPYVSSVDGWGDYVGGQAAFSSAYIGELTAQDITADTISATTGYIDDLTANNITTEKISATTGYIDDLTASNITTEDIIADHASIEDLDANYAHISNGVIDNATIGYADVNQLDANYAKINLENVNNSWITNGVIKNAAITDAQIIGVSANKLTAGTIDASKINVTNLNTDNLQVKKINGQPVLGGYLAVDSSASGYDQSDPSALGWYEIVNGNYVLSSDTTPNSNKAYYIHTASVALYDQTYINSMESDLNDRIDGAIETWTGSAVPTLNNYPASSWTTDDAKSSHVGDIYYVINASQSADGYCYRFAYDSTSDEFVWVLIKDSDVTAALSRLVTAEGKITGLETFETETSLWIDETDEGLTSIRTRTTNLETAVGNKVDTSTFNTLSNTVDSNTASITALSHTVDGYEDSQGVIHEGLVNTVNTVSQTATSNSSTISQLTTTLGTNSDGTTKTGDVVQRTTAVEQDLAGYKTTVSNTYATNARVSQAETSIAQTATDVTTIINSMTTDSKNLIVYFPDPSSKVDKLYNDKMKTSGGVVRWGQLYAVDGSSSAWAGAAPYVRNYASGATEAASRYFMLCPIQKNIFRPGDTIKIEGRIYNRGTAVNDSKITIWFYSTFDQAAGTSTNAGSYSTNWISLAQNTATDFDRVINIPSDADFSNKYYYVIGIDLMDKRRAELLSTSIAVRINNYDNVFTMVRQYGDGVLVCKNSNTVGALINANGSFDVVNVTWSNGVPTAGTVISSYGSNSIIIGKSDGYNARLDATDLRFRYGSTGLATYGNSSIVLGKTDGYNARLDGTDLRFRNGTTVLATYSDSAITLGQTSGQHISMSSNEIGLYDTAAKKRVKITAANGLDMYASNGTTNIANFSSTIRLGQSSKYYTKVSDANIEFIDGSTSETMMNMATVVNSWDPPTSNVTALTRSVRNTLNLNSKKSLRVYGAYDTWTTKSSSGTTSSTQTYGGLENSSNHGYYIDDSGNLWARTKLSVQDNAVPTGTYKYLDSGAIFSVYDDVTQVFAASSSQSFVRGNFKIINTANVYRSSHTAPTSTVAGSALVFYEKDSTSNRVGYIRCEETTSKGIELVLTPATQGPSSEVGNTLKLGVNTDGSRYVTVNDAAAWRSGIGAAAASAITKSRITDVNDAIDSYTSANKADVSVDIYKVGNLMMSMRISFKLNVDIPSGTDRTILTLKSGFRPRANMYLNANITSTFNTWVTNGGVLHVKPTAAISSGTTLFFTGTWVLY